MKAKKFLTSVLVVFMLVLSSVGLFGTKIALANGFRGGFEHGFNRFHDFDGNRFHRFDFDDRFGFFNPFVFSGFGNRCDWDFDFDDFGCRFFHPFW